nr:ATP-citrate synthase alpha chain protein 2 [Ipomoea batatas]
MTTSGEVSIHLFQFDTSVANCEPIGREFTLGSATIHRTEPNLAKVRNEIEYQDSKTMMLCFVLDLRCLSPPLLRDLEHSLLQVANFNKICSSASNGNRSEMEMEMETLRLPSQQVMNSRMLCHVNTAGDVIGNNSFGVRHLENQTGCRIVEEKPIRNCMSLGVPLNENITDFFLSSAMAALRILNLVFLSLTLSCGAVGVRYRWQDVGDMARKKIREYDSKRLLKEHLKHLSGIDLQICSVQVAKSTDFVELTNKEPWLLSTKLVVKPDMLFGKCGKNGLVALKLDLAEVAEFVKACLGVEVEMGGCKAPITIFIVEPFPLHMRGELHDTAVFKNIQKWGNIEFPLFFGSVSLFEVYCLESQRSNLDNGCWSFLQKLISLRRFQNDEKKVGANIKTIVQAAEAYYLYPSLSL